MGGNVVAVSRDWKNCRSSTFQNPSQIPLALRCPPMIYNDLRRTAGLRPIFLVRDYEPRPTLPQWTAWALPLLPLLVIPLLFVAFPTLLPLLHLIGQSPVKGSSSRVRLRIDSILFPPPPPHGAFCLPPVLPHGVFPFPPLPQVSFSALQLFPYPSSLFHPRLLIFSPFSFWPGLFLFLIILLPNFVVLPSLSLFPHFLSRFFLPPEFKSSLAVFILGY